MGMSLSRRRWLLRCSAPIVLVLSAGCATGVGGASTAVQPKKDSSQAALKQRAQAYWDAVQKNDRVAAWKFEARSKDPAATLDAYLKRSGITYDKVDVRDVKSVEGDDAVVDVWMRYSIPLLRLKEQEAVAPDAWRLIDGVWYHVLQRSSMFQSQS